MLRYEPEIAKKIAINMGDEKLQNLDVIIQESQRRSRRPIRSVTRDKARNQLVEKYPIQIIIATNWIRQGDKGDPGLCFFTNMAIANLFSLFDWAGFNVKGDDISAKQIEQTCIRMGLRKADDKSLIYSDAKRDPKTNVILLNDLPPKQAGRNFSRNPQKLRAPIKIGERTLYAGSHQ